MARQIARLAARPAVQSLADEPLSLGLTKAVVRRSSLLVTTDSGPRHFAAAFDRPVEPYFQMRSDGTRGNEAAVRALSAPAGDYLV